MDKQSAFTYLTEQLKRIHYLSSTLGILGWDEQVNLPSGATELRANQMAVLSNIIHSEGINPKIGEALSVLESEIESLNADQCVIVREARKNYDRSTKIPSALVEAKARLDSEAYHNWTHAREKSDFSIFAPYLEKQISLSKEIAAHLGYEGRDAYEYYLDIHDPGLTSAFLDQLFGDLKKQLVPLAEEIIAQHATMETPTLKGFEVAQQEAFLRRVIRDIGFDFNHGRLDRSIHPFCGGDALDIRMTTRFFADNPLDSLFSAIHETGHALYEQGLSQEYIGTALSSAVGMAIHESQSRLWENQIARSPAFWAHYEPSYREAFPQQLNSIDSATLYRTINKVSRCPIRVDSDEVTYNLHIILRYEIEKRLFDGSLSINDLPTEWNRLSGELLNIDPSCDREGCLQDVHWSAGAFGYFPSYTLGNMIAAQLWEKLQIEMPDIEAQIAEGKFSAILQWLRTNIHQHGRRWDTRELTRKVTGNDISPTALLTYLKKRYGASVT